MPRIIDAMKTEYRQAGDTESLAELEVAAASTSNLDWMVFKPNGRIYEHKVMLINFTTGDVRRDQDVITPSGAGRNVMMLADNSAQDAGSTQRYCYARVLGIYHAYVLYMGPGFKNQYRYCRVDFLWVRWYQRAGLRSGGSWSRLELERLEFPSVTEDGAFSFINPSDVLRGCHLIPKFAKGASPFRGLSRLAQDSDDWSNYYVSR